MSEPMIELHAIECPCESCAAIREARKEINAEATKCQEE